MHMLNNNILHYCRIEKNKNKIKLNCLKYWLFYKIQHNIQMRQISLSRFFINMYLLPLNLFIKCGLHNNIIINLKIYYDYRS